MTIQNQDKGTQQSQNTDPPLVLFFSSNRYDTGRYRLPECLCLVSRRPFFGLFHSVLAIAQALRLLHDPDTGTATALSDPRNTCGAVAAEGACKLKGFLNELWAGIGGSTEGVPGPGKELSAYGHRFVRPVDEHMSLDDIAVTPLLVSVFDVFKTTHPFWVCVYVLYVLYMLYMLYVLYVLNVSRTMSFCMCFYRVLLDRPANSGQKRCVFDACDRKDSNLDLGNDTWVPPHGWCTWALPKKK